MCVGICSCLKGDCNATTGHCACYAGWTGRNCSKQCSLGTWGKNCTNICHCEELGCDHYTGVCNISAKITMIIIGILLSFIVIVAVIFYYIGKLRQRHSQRVSQKGNMNSLMPKIFFYIKNYSRRTYDFLSQKNFKILPAVSHMYT